MSQNHVDNESTFSSPRTNITRDDSTISTSADEHLLVELGLGVFVQHIGYLDIDPARRLIGRAGWTTDDWHALDPVVRARIVEAAEAVFPDDLHDAEWGFCGDIEALWIDQARMMRGL